MNKINTDNVSINFTLNLYQRQIYDSTVRSLETYIYVFHILFIRMSSYRQTLFLKVKNHFKIIRII